MWIADGLKCQHLLGFTVVAGLHHCNWVMPLLVGLLIVAGLHRCYWFTPLLLGYVARWLDTAGCWDTGGFYDWHVSLSTKLTLPYKGQTNGWTAF